MPAFRKELRRLRQRSRMSPRAGVGSLLVKGRSLSALGLVGIAAALLGLASVTGAAGGATRIADVSSASGGVSAGAVVASVSAATTKSTYVQLKQTRVVTASTTLLRATIKLE